MQENHKNTLKGNLSIDSEMMAVARAIQKVRLLKLADFLPWSPLLFGLARCCQTPPTI